LSIRAQDGLTASISRIVIGVAHDARTRLNPTKSRPNQRIPPTSVIPGESRGPD
jgi:hypothetical protein